MKCFSTKLFESKCLIVAAICDDEVNTQGIDKVIVEGYRAPLEFIHFMIGS